MALRLHTCTKLLAGCAALGASLAPSNTAQSHPHVWVEANLEIVRNEKGEATEIRHVWRFDEIFTLSLLLDFDKNTNDKLEPDELEEIASITRQSLMEYNFYTEVRSAEGIVDFYEPDPYIVDMQGDRLVMIMSLALTSPQPMGAEGFKVAVSDPTYYVAVELVGDEPVLVSGNGQSCDYEIVVPDWDALYARDAQRLADLFAAAPDEKVEPSEDYLTWIQFGCGTA